MSIKQKILFSLGAMIIGSSTVLAINFPSVASNAGGGSTFQHSCRNIRISGNVLRASCRKRNGRFRRSAITLRGIYNKNGILTRGGKIASFHRSCKNIKVSKNLLAATCRKRNGRLVKTAIFIDNITNRNGRLTYK